MLFNLASKALRSRYTRHAKGLFLALLLAVGCAGTLAGDLTVDGQRAFAHVEKITAFGPHPAGSSAQLEVARYIISELESLGLAVAQDQFSASTPLGSRTMHNVWGILPGESEQLILIASHYDSKLFPQFEFVGANDSGSSTGLLLELARVLSNRNPTGHSLWFVFFDGEEAFVEWTDADSLYGSRRFVEQLQLSGELSRVEALILLDMVGARGLVLDRDLNSTSWLVELMWNTAERMGYGSSFPYHRPTAIVDDHIPFQQLGIPVIDLIGYAHYQPFWHTPADTLDKLDPKSLEIVGNVVLASLPDISKRLAETP